MKKHVYGPLAIGVVVVITLLISSVAPGHAGSGSWGMHGRWSGGGRHGGGWHGRHACCFRPRFFVGVGVPFWYPYPYAYGYPYPVYSPPPVVESSPPVYVQQQREAQHQAQYWYYCQGSQTYYPYVKECPDGWLQVAPQASPPPPAPQ